MLKKQQAAISRIRIARFLLNVLSKSEDKLSRLAAKRTHEMQLAPLQAPAPRDAFSSQST
jgi:hypothetical protein